jgi:hypothetical protein
VYEPGVTTTIVFEKSIIGPVKGVSNGDNVKIVAYGASGSGKTTAMMGKESPNDGIVPHSIDTIFSAKKPDREYEVKISAFEMCGQETWDLLGDPSRPCSLQKVASVEVKAAGDARAVLAQASSRRATKPSKSHVVFHVSVTTTKKGTADSVTGTLSLIDLASSEGVEKAADPTEARILNLDLDLFEAAVGQLRAGKSADGRGGELARYLHGSMGGIEDAARGKARASKSIMVILCTANLGEDHIQETKATLRLAQPSIRDRKRARPREQIRRPAIGGLKPEAEAPAPIEVGGPEGSTPANSASPMRRRKGIRLRRSQPSTPERTVGGATCSIESSPATNRERRVGEVASAFKESPPPSASAGRLGASQSGGSSPGALASPRMREIESAIEFGGPLTPLGGNVHAVLEQTGMAGGAMNSSPAAAGLDSEFDGGTHASFPSRRVGSDAASGGIPRQSASAGSPSEAAPVAPCQKIGSVTGDSSEVAELDSSRHGAVQQLVDRGPCDGQEARLTVEVASLKMQLAALKVQAERANRANRAARHAERVSVVLRARLDEAQLETKEVEKRVAGYEYTVGEKTELIEQLRRRLEDDQRWYESRQARILIRRKNALQLGMKTETVESFSIQLGVPRSDSGAG